MEQVAIRVGVFAQQISKSRVGKGLEGICKGVIIIIEYMMCAG